MSAETAAAYAEALPGVVYDLAEPHVASSGGMMVHLDWNPEVYKDQAPGCFVAKSQSVINGVDNRLPVAEGLQRGYGDLRDLVLEDQASADAMDEAKDALASNKNVAVITPHDNIIDIALALLITKDGIEGRDHKVAKTAIMLSKMLSGVGYKNEYIDPADGQKKIAYVPAVMALGYLCELTYLSWPSTESAREHTSRFPDNERHKNNENVTEHINKQLDKGGVLLGTAATGTTRVKKSEGGVILPDPSPGTKLILSRPDTLLLAMILNLEEGNLSGRIPFSPENPKTIEGVDEFMGHLERDFNERG